MDMMRPLGKSSVLLLAGIVVQFIVIVTVLVQMFITTGPARAVYDLVSGWPVSMAIYNFIGDWAGLLSVLASCVVLAVIYFEFRKQRRERALGRIHDWARNIVLVLADFRQVETGAREPSPEQFERINDMISRLEGKSHGALADARVLGGELGTGTKKAVNLLSSISQKIEKHDPLCFEDLRALHHSLADIMISAFDTLQRAKAERLGPGGADSADTNAR